MPPVTVKQPRPLAPGEARELCRDHGQVACGIVIFEQGDKSGPDSDAGFMAMSVL
jgi:hypothetical protein